MQQARLTYINDNFLFLAGCSVEIAEILQRLEKENKEKQEQIERMGQIQDLQQMVQGPIQSGTI